MSEKHKNLVFTGLMGSGKTTIGRLVAGGLNRQFVDTDQFLQEKYGSAKQILERPNGDAEFAAIEEDIAQELSVQKRLVIATGGRFLLNPKNVAALSKSSKFLCLTASLEALVIRLSHAENDTYRPRFIAAENKLKLMQELQKLSEPHLKDFEKIATEGKSPEDVADELIKRFR